MAKISSWHFRHPLWVVWLKTAWKGGSREPLDPPGTPMVLPGMETLGAGPTSLLFVSNWVSAKSLDVTQSGAENTKQL